MTLSPSVSARTSVSLVIFAPGGLLLTVILNEVVSLSPSSSVTVAWICFLPVNSQDLFNWIPSWSQSLVMLLSLFESRFGSKSQHTISESTSEGVSDISAETVKI